MMTKLISYVYTIGSERFETFYHDGVQVTPERFADLLSEYKLVDPLYGYRHDVVGTDICDIFIFSW